MTERELENFAERVAEKAAAKAFEQVRHECLFTPEQRKALHRLGEKLTDDKITSLSLLAGWLDIVSQTIGRWVVIVLLLGFMVAGSLLLRMGFVPKWMGN